MTENKTKKDSTATMVVLCDKPQQMQWYKESQTYLFKHNRYKATHIDWNKFILPYKITRHIENLRYVNKKIEKDIEKQFEHLVKAGESIIKLQSENIEMLNKNEELEKEKTHLNWIVAIKNTTISMYQDLQKDIEEKIQEIIAEDSKINWINVAMFTLTHLITLWLGWLIVLYLF